MNIDINKVIEVLEGMDTYTQDGQHGIMHTVKRKVTYAGIAQALRAGMESEDG